MVGQHPGRHTARDSLQMQVLSALHSSCFSCRYRMEIAMQIRSNWKRFGVHEARLHLRPLRVKREQLFPDDQCCRLGVYSGDDEREGLSELLSER